MDLFYLLYKSTEKLEFTHRDWQPIIYINPFRPIHLLLLSMLTLTLLFCCHSSRFASNSIWRIFRIWDLRKLFKRCLSAVFNYGQILTDFCKMNLLAHNELGNYRRKTCLKKKWKQQHTSENPYACTAIVCSTTRSSISSPVHWTFGVFNLIIVTSTYLLLKIYSKQQLMCSPDTYVCQFSFNDIFSRYFFLINYKYIYISHQIRPLSFWCLPIIFLIS